MTFVRRRIMEECGGLGSLVRWQGSGVFRVSAACRVDDVRQVFKPEFEGMLWC